MHCKVCDFGLSRTVQSTTNNTMTRNIGTLLYLCPEMLTDNDNNSNMDKASRATKVDVYSFGMIMWEVFFEQAPYTESSKTCKLLTNQQPTNPINVLTLVVNGKRPSIPFDTRDELLEWMQVYPVGIPSEKCGIVLGYFELVRVCWDVLPRNRPDFQTICKRLRSWINQME